jgi:hypothetical protein
VFDSDTMLTTVQESSTGTRPRDTNVHVSARAAQESEYQNQIHNIRKLQRQLESQEEQLMHISQSLVPHEESDRLMLEKRIAEYHADPRSIAPEDALDTIVRLENHLKLQQRRNQLHAKELDKQRRQVKERRQVLENVSRQRDEVLRITGWDGRTQRSEAEQQDMKEKIVEMAGLAKRLQEEHRAANLIIHKKEHVVDFLNEELTKRSERREALDEKYNAIRVADRDNREILTQIGDISGQNSSQDNAIVVARGHQDTVALECLRDDNVFLAAQIKEKKSRKVHQDRVMKAQIDRTKQLTTRFEVLGGALRDLGLDRQAQTALSAVPPPVDPEGEPDNLDRIAPPDEQVPTCFYELLIRDMASIRSAVARKDVMVVEKQCVAEAMQDKLNEYSSNLRFAQQQEAHTKDDKYLEMDHLRQTLADRHHEYRLAIDDLLQENLKLKSAAAKKRKDDR